MTYKEISHQIFLIDNPGINFLIVLGIIAIGTSLVYESVMEGTPLRSFLEIYLTGLAVLLVTIPLSVGNILVVAFVDFVLIFSLGLYYYAFIGTSRAKSHDSPNKSAPIAEHES